jgi:hypothetical protein
MIETIKSYCILHDDRLTTTDADGRDDIYVYQLNHVYGRLMDQHSAGSGFSESAEQGGSPTSWCGRLGGPVCDGCCCWSTASEALTGGADAERSGGHEKGGRVEGSELLELTVEAAVLLR